MNDTTTGAALSRRRGGYGFDAPYVPAMLGGGALVDLVLAFASASVYPAVVGLFLSLGAASFVYATRAGKFSVWSELLCAPDLSGDQRVLDMGCGRGAVLLNAAELVPDGEAVGVDLWKASDQSGNGVDATRRNAEREGVAERVDLVTADAHDLPFPDRSFDLVLSSLAIHNSRTPRIG